MSKHPIESELIKLTKLKQKKRENDQDWMKRLTTDGYLKLDDDVVEDGLTDEAYDWCEAAVAAIKASGAIPLFDPNEDPEEEDEEEEEIEEESEPEQEPEDEAEVEPEPEPAEKPAKKDPKKAAVKAEPKKAPKKKEAKAKKAPKKDPSKKPAFTERTQDFRRLIIEHLELSREELLEMAEASELDLARASLSVIIHQVKSTVEAIEEVYDIKIGVPAGV
jgi:hypothetical protein